MHKDKLKKIIKDYQSLSFSYGIPRDILPSIIKNMDKREIISITGIRRCGKTTLIHQLKKQITEKDNTLYINFEDERLIGFSVQDFDNLIETFYELYSPRERLYLFFDEIQEIENWEKWARRMYDNKPEYKIFVTGSSSSLLSSELSTLLTGRNLSYTLFPFSFREILTFKEIIYSGEEMLLSLPRRGEIKKEFEEYLEKGGFPIKDREYKIELLQQYFKDILYRDIIRRYKIRDVMLLEELFLYLLANISSRYSYNNLKNTFKTGLDTIKEYIQYGIASYLFSDNLYFSYSLKEAYNKNRKIYSIDTGLRNASVFRFIKDTAKLAENIFYIECLRRKMDVYYFYNKNEVDFVIKNKDNTLSLYNICYTDDIPERELKGFIDFTQSYPAQKIKNTIIITKDREDSYENITCIPLWKWLLEETCSIIL